MIVYRFEKDGFGPYIGGVGLKVTTMQVAEPNVKAKKKALRIRNELGIDYEKWHKAHQDRTMLFGCPSKEALRAYFAYRFKPLFREGYRIRLYDIPDAEVINIGYECAFPIKFSRFRTKKALDNAYVKMRRGERRH